MSEPAAAAPRWRGTLPWFKEVLVIGAVYIVYGFVRNQFGSAHLAIGDPPTDSFQNAVRIIDLEKAIGLFHEQTIQNWFLVRTADGVDASWFITFCNVFYGTAHFGVTLGILVWLFVRHREGFGRWRTTLMATTVLGLIGFALFPLMPPRLFNAYPVAQADGTVHRYGGGLLADAQGEPDYGWVDTLRDVGGLWSFDSEKLDSVSNQYAAMPSLHIGWSTWCTLVLLRFAKRRSTKYLAVAYPFMTLTAIVVTANHFIIDAAGALIVVAAAYGFARWLDYVMAKRRDSAESYASAGTTDEAASTSRGIAVPIEPNDPVEVNS